VPTQAIMRIVRDSGASAVALIAPMSAFAAALQLADVDHEQSLTARIVHQPDTEPSLSPWDFGKVSWTVRLRHVLRAARGASTEEAVRPAASPTTAPVRQTEPDDGAAGVGNARLGFRDGSAGRDDIVDHQDPGARRDLETTP